MQGQVGPKYGDAALASGLLSGAHVCSSSPFPALMPRSDKGALVSQ